MPTLFKGQIMDVEGTFFIRISRTKYAISATNASL